MINQQTTLIMRKVPLLSDMTINQTKCIPVGLLSDRLSEEQSTRVEKAKNVKQNEKIRAVIPHTTSQSKPALWRGIEFSTR